MNRHIFAIPKKDNSYINYTSVMKKVFKEAGIKYIPANRRRHYMTTGTSFVEGSDSGTVNMMGKHAGKVLGLDKILPLPTHNNIFFNF